MSHLRTLGVACAAAAACGAPALAQEYRTYDGSGNNLANPQWGAANARLRRLMASYYADGFAALAGPDRGSARLISNLVCAQSQPRFSARVLSTMVMQWGQWIDHDLDFRKRQQPAQFANIPIPMGDPFFDPNSTGTAKILFQRSRFDPASGSGPGNPREQVNVISAFLDCNNIYGSTPQRAASVREFQGGRLLVSAGDLLPWNTVGEDMDTPPTGLSLFDVMLAGDDRANEQLGLLAMHTLWVREHNRLAGELAVANPAWDDQRLYQEARRYVIALNQAITFNEFLPALLGPGAIATYAGYNPQLNPGIANEFAHAAYRFAHSMLNPALARLEEDGTPIAQGHVALRDAFFAPQRLVDEGGIDPLLRGLCAQPTQEIDHLLIDDVRNFLFGPPGIFGLDLAALNIQRGRDHGLPTLNQARAALGLPAHASFQHVTSDPQAAVRLAGAYASVDDIDLWLGGICEDHVPGGNVGPTVRAIIAETFTRVRDGDRLWYRNGQFTPQQLADIESTRLSDVIRRNTGVERIQGNVFFVWPDMNHDGALNLADFVRFQTLYALGDPEADFDKNGVLNLADLSLFRNAFAGYF